MVVPESEKINLEKRNIDVFVYFICFNCVKEKHPRRLRLPGTELIYISRGKCPICKKGDVNSIHPTLMTFLETIPNGYKDEEKLYIKSKIKEILAKYNE